MQVSGGSLLMYQEFRSQKWDFLWPLFGQAGGKVAEAHCRITGNEDPQSRKEVEGCEGRNKSKRKDSLKGKGNRLGYCHEENSL